MDTFMKLSWENHFDVNEVLIVEYAKETSSKILNELMCEFLVIDIPYSFIYLIKNVNVLKLN